MRFYMKHVINIFAVVTIMFFITEPASSADIIESKSLDPPVFLPDGSEFKTWDHKTVYKKTCFVDMNHPAAADENPGTEDKPFRTINHAAQVVKAGERVVIKSGIYREQISPLNGGNGPDEMISYEAAPGARVIIKGSRILNSIWTPSRNPGQFSEKLWMTTLPDSLFEAENPFTIENASAADIEIMPWATEWAGKLPYTLRRGLIFQDDRRLVQLAAYEDLVRLPGSYWVDSTGTILHIHPYDFQNPNYSFWEVTAQQHILKPAVTDLGYIRIKGLTFKHAGNGFPRTGVGAIFTMGGHHWIIEDNFVTQTNSVGIEIGTRSIETKDRDIAIADQKRAKASPGYVIVRNNIVSECGTGGIQGLEVRRALVENNHIFFCGWQDVERYWETGGIKLLVNEKTLVRRNLIEYITGGPAIWLDWNNQNCRITQNMAHHISGCCNGAFFVEASQKPNMIDHNILWDIEGTGVYAGDTDNLVIAFNLIGPCTGIAINARKITDRQLNGRPMTSKGNRVVNNIILAEQPITFADDDNFSDYNIFADPAGLFDLKEWQKTSQDPHSVRMDIFCEFDPQNIELYWETEKLLPLFPGVEQCQVDYYNSKRNDKTDTPGPFRDRFANPVTLDIRPVLGK